MNSQPERRDGDRPWTTVPPEVARVLAPALADLGDEIIVAIRAEVAEYGRPLSEKPGGAIQDAVDEALRRFVNVIEHHDADALGPNRTMYFDLGRAEFREGRSLDVLLSAYRVGARVAWRAFAEAGDRAAVPPETLYAVAEAIFAYIDELSAVSAEGYGEERSAVVGAAQHARREFVELLVAGPPTDPEGMAILARRVGWPLPERLAALVAREADTAALCGRIGLEAIAAQLGDTACVLVPDPEGPGRERQLTAALRGREAALGPIVAWTDAARSFRRARSALELLEIGALGDDGLVRADRHLATMILYSSRELAVELADRRLAPLRSVPSGAQGTMHETLRAWLAHHGNVARVAEVLHVHPQTVRYRLRQLREMFGDDLDDPEIRFELELALRVAAPASRAGTEGCASRP